MPYPVGVDLGATFTAAAVCLSQRVDVVSLGTCTTFIPTVAAVTEGGSLALAEDAAALTGSDRVARQFTRRVGDDTPLVLGGISFGAETLAARFVSFVIDMIAERLGDRAARVALTHPASWGPYRVAALRSALLEEGLGATVLLPGARATAQAYADRTSVVAGDLVALYDLGGSGFDAAVVRRSADGEFILAGRPEAVELGGLDFDEIVFEHVRAALGEQWTALDRSDPAVLDGVAQLRRECTVAKEALSRDTEAWIPVAIPGVDAGGGGSVRLVRAELEELIQPVVEETAAALLRVISSAGAEPDDLAAVLLTGGSAQIPLVTQVVSEVLGRPVTVAENPKADAATGAALVAAGRTAGVADTPAVGNGQDAGEPTRIMPSVPNRNGDDTAPPPPRRPSTSLKAGVSPVDRPVERGRRRYRTSGLIVAGAAALAALLVGGWLIISNLRGSPAEANVNRDAPVRPPTPSSSSPDPSTSGSSGSATQPNRQPAQQPSTGPVGTGGPATGSRMSMTPPAPTTTPTPTPIPTGPVETASPTPSTTRASENPSAGPASDPTNPPETPTPRPNPAQVSANLPAAPGTDPSSPREGS
jgi:molecular chaperone DnaK